MLKGALAAALTPLRDGGEALDEDAFEPYVEYLAAGGLDGILALGTTGEGILLREDERRRAAELFVAAAPDGFDVAVHCGAQTTSETVALAEHAAEIGAAAVAVIGPPYYRSTSAALDAALRRGRRGLRAAPVLPLRVSGSGRVLDPAGGDPAVCASWHRTSPA